LGIKDHLGDLVDVPYLSVWANDSMLEIYAAKTLGGGFFLLVNVG